MGKLLEKIPLNSSVIHNSVVLNPLNIINESSENNRNIKNNREISVAPSDGFKNYQSNICRKGFVAIL